jgi:nicotinamide mononucleotide (NMN) deamidase PncC
LVYLCAFRRGGVARPRREVFAGDRTAVRLSAVATALTLLGELL